MNRRDVIVIAVLINAGLLVVMFASALKSDDTAPDVAMQKEAILSPPALIQPPPVIATQGDEVDQVLSQFATVNSTQASSLSPTAAPIVPSSTQQESPESFTSELQTLPIIPPAEVSTTSALPLQTQKTPTGVPYREVRVKKGDALEKIARNHQTSVQEIMRVNRLSSTQLKIGQVLKIPEKAPRHSSAGASSSAEKETKYYIVKNGDNPWTIAVKNHMKVEELLKLNDLDEEKARKLKPGDQLRTR